MLNMPAEVFHEYCDWVTALDAAIGGRDFSGGVYEYDGPEGEYHCRGCDAYLPSRDARCMACEPFDLESQLDLDYHDALWPNGYGAEGDPGNYPEMARAIYGDIFRRY